MTVWRVLIFCLITVFLLCGTTEGCPYPAKSPAADCRLSAVGAQIVAGWDSFSPAVSFAPSLKLTLEELDSTVTACRNGCPDRFWVGSDYAYTYVLQDGIACITEYRPSCGGDGAAYRFGADERDAFLRRWHTAVESLLTGIGQCQSAEARERLLHDRLLARCRYSADGRFCATAYGAIVEGKANCEGYARALLYLLQRAGIPCRYVEGLGGGRPHAWVAVYINGSWRHTDPCWNDSGSVPTHTYFNLSEAQIRWDHEPTGGERSVG